MKFAPPFAMASAFAKQRRDKPAWQPSRSATLRVKTGPAWIRTRDQGIMSPLLYR